jgi:WD40 repeat protein
VDQKVRVCHLKTAALEQTLEIDTHNATALSFSPVQDQLVVASGDGLVKFLDIKTGKYTDIIQTEEGNVVAIDFPANNLLELVFDNGSIKTWKKIS